MWNSGSRFACQRMEDFDQKWNDELQKLLQRKFKYLLIIYLSVTQKKNPFEASLFWMPGTNGLTKGKLCSILFSSRCSTEVATYFKSHWKHCLSIESFIPTSYKQRRRGSCARSGLLWPRKNIIFLLTPSKCTANDYRVTIRLTKISLWRLYKFFNHTN